MLPSVGLIGDPVAHSISPAMHNAAFAACGFAEAYVLWHTPAAELGQRVAALRALGMRGANVTLPHKTAVMPLLDALHPDARAIGAVNTIVREPNGQLRGLNTDAPGFMRALQHDGYDPFGGSVVLLGAGGAARAVAYALLQGGVRSLVVANRTVERAQALLAALPSTAATTGALALDDEHLDQILARTDLVVNATSVGLDRRAAPLAPHQIHRNMGVVDLIYHTTPLLRAAAERGAWTQHGLEMLVQQGALAFEAWTGRHAPVDVMRAAAQHALEQRR